MLHGVAVATPATAGSARGAKDQFSPGPISAVQKPIEEMCPSPIARRLSADPGLAVLQAALVRVQHRAGLHSAAPSVAYSAVNVAPSTTARAGLSGLPSRCAATTEACSASRSA